ncbi:hypothetical protein SLS62_004559 [Diatrype stigma]|uniref:Uncharacterized protein n=1 Tax=Diatrype stigma TaxID=117547 RepID=A0AAN9YTA5_9PEZI
MRHHSFLSLAACGLSQLLFVTAQTASSITDAAPTPTPTDGLTSSVSPPGVTVTDTTDTSQTSATTSASNSDTTSAGTGTTTSGGGGGSTTATSSSPPDVSLRVPELHVGRIELDVDNLNAEINLAAQVANLVELNAGIQVGIEKVNITIADVDAELELVIRLGNLADIVNRTLASLNLNPLLINILNEATDLVDAVVGVVDGLLGEVVSGGSTISYLIDNLGAIVAQTTDAAGNLVSSVVGDFQNNMTYTGAQELLDGGLVQKTYKYDPLNALVNIVFNSANQVVQAVVVKGGGGGSSTSAVPTATSATATSNTATSSATPTA